MGVVLINSLKLLPLLSRFLQGKVSILKLATLCFDQFSQDGCHVGMPATISDAIFHRWKPFLHLRRHIETPFDFPTLLQGGYVLMKIGDLMLRSIHSMLDVMWEWWPQPWISSLMWYFIDGGHFCNLEGTLRHTVEFPTLLQDGCVHFKIGNLVLQSILGVMWEWPWLWISTLMWYFIDGGHFCNLEGTLRQPLTFLHWYRVNCPHYNWWTYALIHAGLDVGMTITLNFIFDVVCNRWRPFVQLTLLWLSYIATRYKCPLVILCFPSTLDPIWE